MTTILWFRQDLRLDDHDAVLAAAARGEVVPVYVWDPEGDGRWAPGGASRWWLDRSLRSLASALEAVGTRLVVRRGDSASMLAALAKEVGSDRVIASRRFEAAAIEQERSVSKALLAIGASLDLHLTSLLFAPESIRSGSGEPYRVFTPYWRTCLKATGEIAKPREAPKHLAPPKRMPRGDSIDSLGLAPTIPWDAGLAEMWTPGEGGARARLSTFGRAAIDDYGAGRDRPEIAGTSLLSPHLHFGEISPRRVWHRFASREGRSADADKFLAEIGWREFAHHVLVAFPRTSDRPLRSEFERFPWRRDAKSLRAWQRGETGYPMVDAGMRQLWRTGWMHNRVRMIVASFLVKHLLLSWNSGAEWFWDTLVDADLASNTLGWQWSGGCGADAAPYFRIFNPVLQGEKFDPDGAYVRRWVPELAKVPRKFVHRPWEAPPETLRAAGVALGRDYPRPIVDHAMARARALEALSAITSKRASPDA
jgi:deoxyribodipyrimidine photo-lyase